MNIGKLYESIAAVAPIDGVAVGVPNDKSTWRIDFRAEATDAQRAAAQAVIASFVVVDSPRLISSHDFTGRFSPATQAAITAACLTDPNVLFLRLSAAEAGQIDLDSAEVNAALDELIVKGLLTSAEKATVLA
jgi:hypothetical protein